MHHTKSVRFAAALLIVMLASLTAGVAPAHAQSACALKPGRNSVQVASNGKSYAVEVLVPAGALPVALILGLHPSAGNAATFDADTGLGAAALARGFAVALPEGGISGEAGGHYWNIPGVPLVTGDSVPAGARDDIRFVGDVIGQLVGQGCVDPRRVYATGFSGGARMSSALGCRLADRLAAVAPVGGLRAGRASGASFTEPDTGDCQPSRALSVLGIHGTDDPTNAFPGGGGVRWGYSIDRAAARWASLDHCAAMPRTAAAGARVRQVTFSGCSAGSEVVLMVIEAPRAAGGGHVWPGGRGDLATRDRQPSPPTLDATRAVLDFFARHP